MNKAMRFALVPVVAMLSFVAADRGAVAETPGKGEAAAMIRSFGLEISSGSDLALEIRVNDVPVSGKSAGSTAAQSIPIHGAILPGRNRVEILIGTASIPVDAAPRPMETPFENAALTVKLQEDHVTEPQPGEYVVEAVDLETRRWRPADDGAEPVMPQSLVIDFEAPNDLRPPIWVEASPGDPEALREDLERAYAALIDMLKSGDADEIGVASRVAYAEAARAYPLGGDAAERERTDVAEIGMIAAYPDVSFPEFSTPLKCAGYAGNRVLECFAEDGESPVRALLPGEKPIYFRFRFSTLDGRLTII